ncbi:MAG: SDR family oxidoreductase [Thermoleophilia bacterium]|nr:SDR family oxidoreductase [Thermoleophilia bacterium]
MAVAVITGGSTGIGLALASRLSDEGWTCVLLARGVERLERAARETGGEAEPCDVGDRTQVEAAAERIGERHASVSLLVNNAGIPGGGGFVDLPAERIEEVTRTNYLGSVWALRAFLPLLRRGAPASVVTVASVAGTVAAGSSGPYAASKHAQLAFSRSVAAELRPLGIRVHSVNPGPVATVGFPQRGLLDRRWARHVVTRPERVAEAIVRAVERGQAETFVPGAFRLAAAAQAIAPATFGRLAARRAER